MTLFLHEKHELLPLVVNSIRKDLTDHNELFNSLALHAIANVGGRELGEALNNEIHRLLISPYVATKLQPQFPMWQFADKHNPGSSVPPNRLSRKRQR